MPRVGALGRSNHFPTGCQSSRLLACSHKLRDGHVGPLDLSTGVLMPRLFVEVE